MHNTNEIKTTLDPYESWKWCEERLRGEFNEHGRLIIAVDFDDTVYDTHNHGWSYNGVINTLKRWQNHAIIILWSSSKPERYPMMKKHFEDIGIRVDKINENADGIEVRGPKIYANIYLDDRSCGLSFAIGILNSLASENGF